MVRRLIGFILSVITAAILFILLVAFFPSKKKSVDIVNMSYIFVDDDWTEHNVFEPIHWSAMDWSFLFKNRNNEEEKQNKWEKWNILWNIDYVWETDIDTWNSSNQIKETWNSENTHLDPNNPFNLPEWAIEKPLPKDCKTPRGITIKHKESILAYQQRSDVPDICNVQRRTCNDWVLDWSFTQPACNEKVIYTYTNSNDNNKSNKETNNTVSYTKKTVISHNDVSKNELIQTPKYTKNEWAKYDKNWKLNGWNGQPKTVIWSNQETLIWEDDSIEQVNKWHYNCISPRWEVVQHWQFIRAYDFPFWFTNASCEVELRLCVDWELKWSFNYKECQYLDVTYEEYNNLAELQSDESVNYWTHEITNKKRQWFFGWLKNLFN